MLPSIFGRSSDNIKNKIDFLIYLGYTKEEALKMTVSNPAIFSHSSNALKEKIEFFKSIGLKYFLVEKPKNLMQSIDLTYARFRYLTVEKNREINKTTVDCLFSSTKRFEQAFGITKEELLGRYSYDAEVRSKRDKNKTKLLEQS